MPDANERPTILIVDDKLENRVTLQAALAGLEYAFVEASSGEEALAILLRRDCAVILMDVAMPGLDGFQTARLIRQREKTRAIPIIFVTALMADIAHVFEGYESGAVDYLTKPFDMHALRAKVAVFAALWRQGREIQRASDALRRAEQREHALLRAAYDVTFENAPVGIGHASLDGRWVRVNRRLAEILGRSRDEILSLRIDDVVHPDDRSRLDGIVGAITQGSQPENKGEYRIVKSNGCVIWAALTVSMIHGAEGEPIHLAIMEDVTKERELALALAASERRFGRLRDANLLGVFYQDGGGTIRAANDELLRIIGYTHEDLASGAITIAALTGNAEAEALPRDELARTGVSSTHETVYVRKDGRHVPVLVGMVADDGGTTAFALDLTASKAADEERARALRDLRATVRARDEFLYLAAHELRNPLTPVVVQVMSLREAARDAREPIAPEWLARQLEPAERAVLRLARLVDDLLDLSRLIVGRLVLEREELDLSALVREVVDRERARLERARSTVEVRADRAVIGSWDRTRLAQVVDHLLTNAAKYAPGRIEITVEGDEDVARLEVRDHGAGIAPEDQARIFERFERGASVQYAGGFGSGLWIVRRIVEEHGGHVELESEPGRGACFRVVLPRRESHA